MSNDVLSPAVSDIGLTTPHENGHMNTEARESLNGYRDIKSTALALRREH